MFTRHDVLHNDNVLVHTVRTRDHINNLMQQELPHNFQNEWDAWSDPEDDDEYDPLSDSNDEDSDEIDDEINDNDDENDDADEDTHEDTDENMDDNEGWRYP